MKVTKTSVHRLTIEKTCGCTATREFADVRYAKPIAEGVFTPCEKHEKNKLVSEFAGEMLIEALDKEAESAGKTVVTHRESATALSGTSGESVTSMGAPNIPKSREKRNPLETKTAKFERPDVRRPTNTAYGNLNVADQEDISPEELDGEGITITGNIDEVSQDPRVDAALDTGLGQLEEAFDAEDVRSGGVSQTLIDRFAVD